MKVISKTLSYFLVIFLSSLALSCLADANKELSQTTTTEIQQVNINSANAEQLSLILKGIGLKKAEAIVAYRENYGEFVNIDELKAVKGIGLATIEKNAHLISLN